MRKKIFVPAQLKEKKWRWYISFKQVHPLTDEWVPFRLTFSMNRIADESERRRYGKAMVKKLNREMLPAGFPFEDLIETQENPLTILDAMNEALEVKREKCNTKKSFGKFQSTANTFKKFLQNQGWEHHLAKNYTRPKCRTFLKYLTNEHGITNNNTYNSYVEKLRSLFGEMKKDSIIKENPWSNVSLRPKTKKIRRSARGGVRLKILNYLRDNDFYLYRVCLLQHYGMVRPGELALIKFGDVDYEKGIINLRQEVVKGKKKPRRSTIPKALLPIFDNFPFGVYPDDWYVFGARFRPAPKTIGHNTMNTRYKNRLKKMVEQGILLPEEIENMTVYGWKDTGVGISLDNNVPPIALQKQLGHASLDMTLEYYEEKEVNEVFRDMKVDFEIIKSPFR